MFFGDFSKGCNQKTWEPTQFRNHQHHEPPKSAVLFPAGFRHPFIELPEKCCNKLTDLRISISWFRSLSVNPSLVFLTQIQVGGIYD